MTTMNSNMLVINVRNTSGRGCNCGSWIHHYRRFSGSTRQVCAALGCGRQASVGAHVQIVDRRSSRAWGIVPLCVSCNHSTRLDRFWLKNDVAVVPANTRQTGCSLS